MVDAAMLALVALVLAADFTAGGLAEWLWTIWRHRH